MTEPTNPNPETTTYADYLSSEAGVKAQFKAQVDARVHALATTMQEGLLAVVMQTLRDPDGATAVDAPTDEDPWELLVSGVISVQGVEVVNIRYCVAVRTPPNKP